jgi:carbon-monoxide dehydrogenase small subunit
MKKIRFCLNGRQTEIEIGPGELLLDMLRRRLFLTGTKKGCGEGECGACTVLLDGKPVLSCLLPAMKAHGREVMTIEGMAEETKLHPIQESFLDAGAVQCGFCTPGLILSTKGLLNRRHKPSEAEVKEAISGHLCRCTGYIQILDAIKLAVNRINAGPLPPRASSSKKKSNMRSV